MFGRHKHDFERIAEQFNPPQTFLRSARGFKPVIVERMIYGFTVVTYQCKGCPEVCFRRVTGRSAGAEEAP